MPAIGRRPGDPTGQEGLNPPADTDELRNGSFGGGDIGMIASALLLVLVFAAMVGSIGVRQSRAHMAFMSNCIEKNSEDRCRLLWRYGREDLAR